MPKNLNQELRIEVIDQKIVDGEKYDRKAWIKDIRHELTRARYPRYKDDAFIPDEELVQLSVRQFHLDLKEIGRRAARDGLKLSKREGTYRYVDSNEKHVSYYSVTHIPISPEVQKTMTYALTILNALKKTSRNTTEDLNLFLETLSSKLSIRLRGIDNVISYGINDNLAGLDHLHDLLEYCIEEEPLSINYQPFQKDPEIHIVSPYFLKEYNSRWYLFGKCSYKNNEERNKLYSYPLDRIVSFSKTGGIFQADLKPAHIDDYFSDIIGITKYSQLAPRTIKLKFTKGRASYIDTKPIHPSQQLLGEENGLMVYTIHVRPNYELISTINYFGDDCVSEPSVTELKLILKNSGH